MPLHCTATIENPSTADERNWKSGSNVLHALHTAWLMGYFTSKIREMFVFTFYPELTESGL